MINTNSAEILQIIEAVAREKGLPKDNVIVAMEQALDAAGRRKYGQELNIKSEISRKQGDIKIYRIMKVVDEIVNPLTEIDIGTLLEKNIEANVGDEIKEALPPIDLDRIAAQTAKQIIIQRVNEAEREKQYHDFKSRKGEIINGVVRRVEFNGIIVDLGRTEAIIKRDQLVRGEVFKIGDRIKAYVQDVRLEVRGPQIFLSRTDNMMLAKLLELEVPEIYDGAIQIMGIARDPGSKAKVAVFAPDTSIDAVGSCVGIRGNRIKNVTNELSGEKIDIILWHKDFAQFVINAMAPAEISKVLVDEINNKVEIIVASDQLSIAIGRRGQNVRLASKLTSCNIDVMDLDQESKKRNEEFNTSVEHFTKTLDVEEVIGQLLSSQGYNSIEQVASALKETIASIDGFDDELAQELIRRANAYIESKNDHILSELEDLGVEQNLIDILNLPADYILKLAKYGIKTVEDLEEITIAELRKLVPDNLLKDEELQQLLK